MTTLNPPAPLTVRELAQRVEGAVEGDHDALIYRASGIEDAEAGDIVFAESPRFLTAAAQSRASAIVAFLEATIADKPLIKVSDPRHAFTKILEMFQPRAPAQPGRHETAVVSPSAEVSADASIGPHVVVGDGACIGPRSVLLAGCSVGVGAVIGADCVLHPNVTLYAGTRLGCRVVVHSGTVLGADGFGYTRIGDRSYKVPQIGIVDVGDDVEIGANCAIDRAKTGATIIGARTKIDNLVHIAHNVQIGEDCVIVAQVGIAGSVQVGRGAILAGQAGLKDHIRIGEGAVVMAQAGLFGDVPAGEQVSGYPARPHRERLRADAAVLKLPDYVRRIRELEKSNAELRELVSSIAGRIEEGDMPGGAR